MIHSARRMAMPDVPEQMFLEGVRTLVDCQREWIPEAPGSLYIRPAMIGTEACLGVRASHEYLFFVIVLPSGGYFPGLAPGKTGTVKVFVSETVGRAAEGGTGDAKAAANFSVTLLVIEAVKLKGCAQDELMAQVKSGQVREAFACGTAAVITGIESFVLEDGSQVRVADGQCGPVTHQLFDALRNIQYGVSKDPFGWVVKV
jgi:branched-subunit amino acid aminotransferase/4-amino-4-deoxychorismate lyase